MLIIMNIGFSFVNFVDGFMGWWGVRGIVYSEVFGLFYVGSKNNCVMVFDINFNELFILNIGNLFDGCFKVIGIVMECCVFVLMVNIDNIICYDGINDEIIFL